MGQAQQELNSFGDSAIFGDKNQVRDLPSALPHLILFTTARLPHPAAHDPVCTGLHLLH
jgi:hypothetical protein